MNFARFCLLNAKKYPGREFAIESWPSKGLRRTLTWKQLNDESNKLANYLIKECGVKKGDVVIHLLMNSLEWIVAYFGVIKTGAVVAPLNFRFASSDIKYAAEVKKSEVSIFGSGFLPKVQPIQRQMDYMKYYICVGENVPLDMKSYGKIMETGDPTDVLVEMDDDSWCELMFTSGTTGPAKPVCHTHGSLFSIACANGLSLNEGYDSVYCAAHAFYHSGSWFLGFPCYVGAGKYLMPMELEPRFLMKSLSDEKCTGGWLSVPTWGEVVNAIKCGEVKVEHYDLSHMRYISLGAQPVPQKLIEDSKKIFPKIKFLNMYGTTEGGGGGSVILYDEDILRKPGSVGKATALMEANIVDENGKEVPRGKPGEIVITGARLMKEYAFNPEMTAKTIVDGWLHTGDIGYRDKEGYIFYVDRQKDLIIRGGENIYPVEIEEVLHRHPKIENVAVIGYPDPRLVEIAMAVIQLKPGETMTQEEVVEFCRNAGLAKYKWPEKVIFADVPWSPTGKVEKLKLREKYCKDVIKEGQDDKSHSGDSWWGRYRTNSGGGFRPRGV